MVFSKTSKMRPARRVPLPIHPLVTLEDWVGAIQYAIMDGSLIPSQAARSLEAIYSDPEALRQYEQACRDEQMLAELFAQARSAQPEPAA